MSKSDSHRLKSAVFLAPDDFSVERVFPIRNLVQHADTSEDTPEEDYLVGEAQSVHEL
jgi:hypothetical protein